jgi:hypothetical protein
MWVVIIRLVPMIVAEEEYLDELQVLISLARAEIRAACLMDGQVRRMPTSCHCLIANSSYSSACWSCHSHGLIGSMMVVRFAFTKGRMTYSALVPRADRGTDKTELIVALYGRG